MKDKGLGDTIQRFTTVTGIRRFAESMSEGCNACDKRKDWFNKNFPYNMNKK